MNQMFYGCLDLNSLDLSSFNTSKVIYMNQMFYGCRSLISLDLSNFDFSSISDVENMFSSCSSLEYIDISNFKNNPNGIENMFLGVKSNLVYCIKEEGGVEKMKNIFQGDECKISACSDNYEEINKKLITAKNKCIDKCFKDDIYKYEYKSDCYISCPEDTVPNDQYLCEEIVNEEDNDIFQCEKFFLGKYKIKNKNIDIINMIINTTITEIIKGSLDSLISHVIGESKKEYIVNEDTEIYQITSTFNQNKKKFYNISTIYLGECEDILKKIYKINEDLVIFKFDYFMEGLNIPIIKFEVFHPKTNIKLDLNYCKNAKIYFNIPKLINEEDLFKYNPKSEYYNNICYPYSTENGTDITLKDRKNDYNIKNMSLCEKNCEFFGYDTENSNVICECNIENKSPLGFRDIINSDKLLNNFIDIKSILHINVMKCYGLHFSKEGLKNNIGNYILLSIILINIIFIIIFYLKGYKNIIDIIKNIIETKTKNNKIEQNEKNSYSIKSYSIGKKRNNNKNEIENLSKIQNYNSFNMLENKSNTDILYVKKKENNKSINHFK